MKTQNHTKKTDTQVPPYVFWVLQRKKTRKSVKEDKKGRRFVYFLKENIVFKNFYENSASRPWRNEAEEEEEDHDTASNLWRRWIQTFGLRFGIFPPWFVKRLWTKD